MKKIIVLLVMLSSFCMSQNEKINIAVMDLQPIGITEEEARSFNGKLTAEIFSAGIFNVIERSMLAKIMEELSLQQTGCVESSCAIEVGQLAGVQKMVMGSVGKTGETFSINLRIVNVETGEIEQSITDDCSECTIDDFLVVTVHNAARKIVGLQPDKKLDSRFGRNGSASKGFGDMFISSNYKNAEIYVDGKLQKERTPSMIEKVPAGEHTVLVKLGYLEGKTVINVSKDGLVRTDITMQKKLGAVKIVTNPINAEVFALGKSYGKTPMMLSDIDQASVTVKVTKEDYLDETFTVKLDPDNVGEKSVTLRPASYLSVFSVPLGADVKYNGMVIGKTPLDKFPLPAGNDSILIEKVDYVSQVIPLNLLFKQNIQVNQTLELNDSRKSYNRTRRKIIFGTLGALFAGAGYYLDTKVSHSNDVMDVIYSQYKNSSSSFESYKTSMEDEDSKRSTYELGRDISYISAGMCGAGFLISFVF